MKTAAILISLGLTLSSAYAAAETTTESRDYSMTTTSGPGVQVVQASKTRGEKYTQDSKTLQQEQSPDKKRYEVPVSDYNNGGYFGD